MELRHLRYFLEVARQGNISRASQKLFVAQPALSMQIQQLESIVGTKLLVRGARGVTLTEAGRRMQIEAQAILDHAERAANLVQQVGLATQETVRIGYIPSAAHSILPVLVDAARNAPQRIALQSKEMISVDLFEALEQGSIEAAISRPLELPSGVQALAGMTDPYCLAVHASHALARRPGALPLTLAAQEDFVSFSRFQSPAYFDRVVALCIDASFSPRIRHEAGGFGNALQMVALGLGVCVVPASLVLSCPKDVVFRSLQGSQRSDRLALLVPARNAHPVVQAFARPVQRKMRELHRVIKLLLR
ncbi:MAG: LysR substrate-binding domain-containing protein [Polaromonas sp.]|nr:LysR substrate-binding domain-containing protein [Polaromonas sp.]